MRRGVGHLHHQLTSPCVLPSWEYGAQIAVFSTGEDVRELAEALKNPGADESKEDTDEREFHLSDLYKENVHEKQPFAAQGIDTHNCKEDSDGEDAEEDKETEDEAEPEVKPRGEVYDSFDDLGELDEFELLDGLDELDEIALRVDQKDFEPDSLMGVPGEVPIDEEVLNKLEMMKEHRGFVSDSQQQQKADDEHLRFKTQQRRMEEIASAMGTYVPPISGKPFKARKADALENDLEELKREHGVKHPRVIKMLVKLASDLDEHKKFAGSESIYRNILNVREEVWGKAHESTAIATIALGNNLRNQGETDEAEEIIGNGMDMLVRASPDTVKSLITIGDKLLEEGEIDKAEGMHQAAVVLAKFTHGECHTEVLTALRHLVQTILNSEHFEDAERFAKEELRLRKKLEGEESPEVAVSIATIGYCCMAMQNYREADLEIREGLAMRRKLVGKVDQEVGRMTHYLGEALMALGMHKEAEDIFKEGISIYERLGYQRLPILASAMICLSDALLAQNKLREHHSVRRHAIAMHQKLGVSVFGED